MSDVQIAVIDQQDTQIVLAVPGVQGATGSEIPTGGTADQVLRKNSSTNYDTNWSQVTSAMIADGTIVNADVNNAAAIAGTKISPDFGGQAVTTTGQISGARVNVTDSTAPTNGLYLPSANSVALSTNGQGRLYIAADGKVGIGQSVPVDSLHVVGAARFGTTNFIGIGADGSGSYLESAVGTHVLRFNTNGTERLRITSAGLVGIGTSTPSAKLVVDGGTSGDQFRLGTDPHYYKIGRNSTSGPLEFYGTQSGVTGYVFGGVDGTRLTIDSSGRVGIGTTSPLYPLHVERDQEDLLALVNAGVVTYRLQVKNDASLAVVQNATERARIDSSGRLLVGTSSARSNFFNGFSSWTPQHQIETAGSSSVGVRSVSFTYGRSNGDAPIFAFAKHRSDSIGGTTVVQSGDGVGVISFQASDGTDFVEAANISAVVDGTPGANDMPGRLVFSVTADGASSPTEAMRIKNSRILNFANTPVYADNAAAKTGGLVDGDVYRKSDGTLMIVYT